MELFNKFTKTIFLKENSDLIKQLEDLEAIRNKLSDTEEIDKDIQKLKYGIEGEKQIKFELDNANLGLYVLHDVTFECDGNKAQIDYIVFSKGYFYLIECKNLYGNITIDKSGQFYREYNYKGKTIKESIYSPYTQAVRHKNILTQLWESRHNKVENFLFGKTFDKLFKPLVVLANDKSYLNLNDSPDEVKKSVIRADQLVNYIKNDLNQYDKDLLSNENTLKKTATNYLEGSIENTTNMANKYLNMLNTTLNNEGLETKLREFRKEKSKKMNVPAYYIFTDEELNNLIAKMPKTVEELKEQNILSEIKIKCHAAEIIEILNR